MKIAFVLYPQILATGVSIPVEMFHAAAQTRGHRNSEPLEICFVAAERGPVSVTAGVQIVADHSFDELLDVDWVFVPPMWGSPWKVLQQQVALQKWLVQHYQSGCKLIATGTGVGMLAMAGLLEGRVATTHWYYLERYKRRFAGVKFQDKHFITHQDGIYCAGSINSQTDLVLFFIERIFGEDALALVEQQFMHELKRSFATPYYEPGGAVHDDEVVSLAQSWMRSHQHEVISMSAVSEIAGQSERQLRRRFQNAIGESPQQYLMRIRIEQAQELLRETNLTVTDIAHACGFSGSAYFTRAFRQQANMTPGNYRKIVRNKQFSAD